MALHGMSAVDAAAGLREGRFTARALVDDCLARIAEVEEGVQAWAYLDPDHARAQAERCDELRFKGRPSGPLHGLPVGIKDIFDTADMPTEFGSPLFSGHRPRRDATVVSKLRAAGAVILGKTVTTEFAAFAPGKTANPHDPQRTPGGSSSGSAAAVAAGMCPLALGSQTTASVIRPAAFCGIYGFKPSFGTISRQGLLRQSAAVDHVGTFARHLEDIALITEVIAGYDPADPATQPLAALPLSRVLAEAPPVPPTLAFVKTPAWDRAEPAMQEACGELVAALGERVEEVVLPEVFERVLAWHDVVTEADIATNFAAVQARGADQISDTFNALIESGRQHSAVAYNQAINARPKLLELLDEIFDSYDAILTPAATGEAPADLAGTGNPVFGTLWSFTGVPAISLPLFRGEAGLPMGIQLVGQAGDDARLLRTARWLVEQVSEE